jgi:endonuclease YncB( thermonuclease family)
MAIYSCWRVPSVRLIGVGTPKRKHLTSRHNTSGRKPPPLHSAWWKRKRVRLEFDPANASTGHKANTRQRRTLTYVFLDDGTLLNAEIIKQGLLVLDQESPSLN